MPLPVQPTRDPESRPRDSLHQLARRLKICAGENHDARATATRRRGFPRVCTAIGDTGSPRVSRLPGGCRVGTGHADLNRRPSLVAVRGTPPPRCCRRGRSRTRRSNWGGIASERRARRCRCRQPPTPQRRRRPRYRDRGHERPRERGPEAAPARIQNDGLPAEPNSARGPGTSITTMMPSSARAAS